MQTKDKLLKKKFASVLKSDIHNLNIRPLNLYV